MPKVLGILTSSTVEGVLAEAKEIKGGYVVIDKYDDIDTIAEGVRVQGMPVYVSDTKQTYRWTKYKTDAGTDAYRWVPDTPIGGNITEEDKQDIAEMVQTVVESNLYGKYVTKDNLKTCLVDEFVSQNDSYEPRYEIHMTGFVYTTPDHINSYMSMKPDVTVNVSELTFKYYRNGAYFTIKPIIEAVDGGEEVTVLEAGKWYHVLDDNYNNWSGPRRRLEYNNSSKVSDIPTITTNDALANQYAALTKKIGSLDSAIDYVSYDLIDVEQALTTEINDINNRLNDLGFKGPYFILGTTRAGSDSTDSIIVDGGEIIGKIGQMGKVVYGYLNNGSSLHDASKVGSIWDLFITDESYTVIGPNEARRPDAPASDIKVQWLVSTTSHSQTVTFTDNGFGKVQIVANDDNNNGNDNLHNTKIYFSYVTDSEFEF